MSELVKRGENGRFLPGSCGGPGRLPVDRERKYAETMRDVVSVDDWRAICKRAVEDARSGDHRARSWLAKFLIGDPQFISNTLHVHQEVAAEQKNPYEYCTGDEIIEARVTFDNLRRASEARRVAQADGSPSSANIDQNSNEFDRANGS